MKTLIASLFLVASLALPATDFHFMWTPESVPSSLPGADVQPVGVLVAIPDSGELARVCVSYADPQSQHSECVNTHSAARFNIGGNSTLDQISITIGGVTKNVNSPSAGVLY